MDFLLSFRSSQKPRQFEPEKKKPTERVLFQHNSYIKFLLLSLNNTPWRIFQLAGVVLRFILTTYLLTISDEEASEVYYDIVNAVLDVFFLIDLISAILYRSKYPKKKRNPRQSSSQLTKFVWKNAFYKPRPIWAFIIDVISLLPWALIRIWVPHNSAWHDVSHIMPSIRIYRLFYYYSEGLDRFRFKSRPVVAFILKFGVFWLVLGHTITCFGFWFLRSNNSKVLDNIRNTKFFDHSNINSWYWMIFYAVQIGMANIGFGDITATTDLERTFVAIYILLGFIILNGYLISVLSNILAEQVRKVTGLRFRIFLMTYELQLRGVSRNAISKVLNFYHSLWNARKGMGPFNEMLVSFPEGIWGQVYFDIFISALDASLIFRSCDEISKRALTKVMRIDLFMAGDVILKRNEVNSNMFYVRKGTIQILSHQDDETEIMTFGSGTIFGQIALLLSLPSKSAVHAASFCEIYTLDRKNLFKVLLDYPEAAEIIRNVHKNMVLNVMADKFEPDLKEPGDKIDHTLTLRSFYKVPKQASKLSSGDICVVNTCPYVFDPNTTYITVWSVLIAILIMLICVYYPYCAVFLRKYPAKEEPLIILIDIFLILNLYLGFATGYVKENVLFSNSRDIFAAQLTKVSTYIDIISLMPLHYAIDDSIREKPIILCCRCLQFYKIHKMFFKAEQSVTFKMINTLRLFKYVLYFFYGGYVMGMTYYLQACYDDPCNPYSWYTQNQVVKETDSPIWVSLYFAIVAMSGTGYGDITASNGSDVVFAIACCLGAVVLFIYLIAEYSANFSLSNEPSQNFTEFANRVISFLVTRKMLPSERLRVRQYLNLQWERNKGYEFTSNVSLFYDTPPHLIAEISWSSKSRALQDIRLFEGVSNSIINEVLKGCKRKIFPPHEVIIYAGDICNNIIVIEEGYCEVIYGVDILQRKIVTIGYEICTMELLLGMSSLCHVRTITHCSIVKVPKNTLLRILLRNPLEIKELNEAVDEFKKNPDIQEVKKRHLIRLHLIVHPSVQKSFFRFSTYRKQRAALELSVPYLRLGLCQLVRYLLGRATVLPYGKFLKVWELSRCFFAFCSAILFPLLPFLQLQVKALFYISYFLDATAWIDLLHICYFNRKNLLVSHPLSTSTHYLKGSFVLDFIFCFPFDRMLFRYVYDSAGLSFVTNSPSNYLRFLRVGQVYRIPATVLNLGRDFLSRPTFFRVLTMMIALTIVFLNFFTSGVVLLCVNYQTRRDGEYFLVIREGAEEHIENIRKIFNFKSEPFKLMLVNFYWICETSFGVGFGDITARNKGLMIYIICVVIFSYLYLNYVIITIVSYLSGINLNLTIFQHRMSQLIKYLKSENVEKFLKKHIINYFEYIWKKNKGMKAQVVIANFNHSLRNDVMLYLYEDTLKQVAAFSDQSESFFRVLSNDLKEVNFQLGAAIYKRGDIISDIYIIHEGEVALVGKDDYHTIELGPGKIFGHFDNTERGIATESAVATKNATVLTLKTVTLYELVRDLQGKEGVENKCEELKFRDALRKRLVSEDPLKKRFNPTMGFSHMLYKYSNYIMALYVILSIFSINEVPYNLAFQTYGTAFICVIVPVEILFLFKIFFGFTTGFVDDAGDFISSHRLIKARYLRLTGFYLDLFTVIPFEVFAFAFPKKDRVIAASWFRITKLLRAYNISHAFYMKLDTVTVNMVLLNTVAVAIWIGTLIHQCTCLWVLVSCYRAYCPDSTTWKLIYEAGFRYMYINSVYFIIVCITTTGFGDVVPHTIIEVIFTIILMIMSFFYTAVFIGQIISTTQKTLYAKSNFDFELEGLKTYLYVNGVPVQTQRMVFRYARNLWRNEKGVQIPELFKLGPPYLLNEVKCSTYGHHINRNPVFKMCNLFFKRQLSLALIRTVYFYGDVIVYEGEVNRTMYFVHSGLVEGRSSSNPKVPKAFEINSYFGFKQGVCLRMPHVMTYRAETYSVILSLQLKRWRFLCKFFPDDIRHIQKIIQTEQLN